MLGRVRLQLERCARVDRVAHGVELLQKLLGRKAFGAGNTFFAGAAQPCSNLFEVLLATLARESVAYQTS